MRPIHKLNGGIGATLCNVCYGMISTGWVEEVLCRECKGYMDLGKFTKKEIKKMVIDEHTEKGKNLLYEMVEKESHKNNSNLNK